MTDNKAIKSDAAATILTAGTKEVTFSGDVIDIQLVELVAVGGAEGTRTITEISSETDGLLVNLGANNDVILGAGTAEFGKLAAGTAVIGHVIVDSGAITVDMGANNDVTVTNPTAVNLKAEVIGTGTFVVQATLDAETVKVIGTVNIAAGQTIAVTGTVTANLGTIAGVATETTLSTLDGKVTICNTGAVVISSGTVTTVSTLTTCSTVTQLVGSNTAHDGADSTSSPHKIGARATTSISGQTLVANNDRTNLYAGVDGVLVTRNHCNLEDIVSGNASNTDGASTQCIAAQAAGIKTYLTSVTLTNTSATFAYVEILDGATIKHTIPVPATGGATVNFDPPIPGTAATAWNFDPSAATTTMICSMVGFKSKA